MIRRAPDRFDRNVFWNYLRARRPTPDEFVMDLADQEGIDDTNRIEWNRTVNKILDWVSDEQARDHHGQDVGIVMYNVAGAVARLNFLPLMRRIMARPDFDTLFYLVALREAAVHGSLDVLRFLLDNSDKGPGYMNNLVIYNAAKYGQAEAVRMLLEDGRFDPAAVKEGTIMGAAAKRGHIEVVKILLADPRVDPTAVENYALRAAADTNKPDVMRVLLADPRVDPTAMDNEVATSVLSNASRGSLETLELLLADPRFDPSFNDNQVLRGARSPWDDQAVRMFLAHPRIRLSNTLLFEMVESDFAPDSGTIQALLQDGRIDPTEGNDRVLDVAVRQGYADVVRLLLQDGRSQPRALFFKRAFSHNDWRVVREFIRDGRLNVFQYDTLIRRIITLAPNDSYHHMLRAFLDDPRARRVFSKEDAQNVLDTQANLFPKFRRILEDYVREIQRGQPLDDSEPPSKMIKDHLLWN